MSSPTTQPKLREIPTFQHIPTLKELMPKTSGLPGVKYLQCAALNMARATREGWLQVHGAEPYIITNPSTGKELAVVLLAQGRAVPGVSYLSGGRECQVDLAIDELMTEPAPKSAVKAPEKPVEKGAA